MAALWLQTVIYLWLQSAPQPSNAGVLEFVYGAAHWLSLKSVAVGSSTPTATTLHWRVFPWGIAVMVLISGALILPAWFAGNWLIHNSALRERCDCCGYRRKSSAEPERCPECGHYFSATDARAICYRSWLRLVASLVLALGGAIGLALSQIAVIGGTLQSIIRGGTSSTDLWRLGSSLGLSSLIVLVISMILFAVWLYLEPNKHFRRA